jgi:vancomycin resistance protein YoaR
MGESEAGMAQPSTAQDVATTLADGFGQALTGFRAWSAHGVDRLRKSVLPDRDEHLAAGSADGTIVAPQLSLSTRQRALALIPKVLLGAALGLLIVAIGLFAFRTYYSDRIYPAVVVGDVNVGGLTASQAEDELNQRAAELEQGTIAFTYNGQTWTPTLAEIGATVNLEESIREAEQLGRGEDAASRLAFTGEILRADQVVPLRSQIDQRVLNSWFDSVDRDINDPAINAQIVVEGTEAAVSPDANGTIVDRTAATQQILGALSTLQPIAVDLPTQVDVPEILASDLEQVKAQVQEGLSEPVRVEFENQTWRIEGMTLTGYVSVETVLEGGKPVAKLSLDTERLASDLRTQFVPEVNRQPVNAQVGWNDNSGLVAIEPSETGVTLKASAFAEAVAASFLGGHDRVDIPVVVTRPEIDDQNLDALGIDTRLGHGDSNFDGGAWQRDENIYVATGLLNGTLVPPGGVFSFNQAIGEITYEKGYVDADVVVAEQIGRDVGGGVCQVSTTVFRAAILAGMPIAEWQPHTYRLSNYERDGWGPGFDASILQNSWQSPEEWPDLKFENYTGGWLLVEAWTDYPTMIVNIYGTDDGREVELDAWGISGKSTGFTRVIYDKNGNEIANRSFATDFK